MNNYQQPTTTSNITNGQLQHYTISQVEAQGEYRGNIKYIVRSVEGPWGVVYSNDPNKMLTDWPVGQRVPVRIEAKPMNNGKTMYKWHRGDHVRNDYHIPHSYPGANVPVAKPINQGNGVGVDPLARPMVNQSAPAPAKDKGVSPTVIASAIDATATLIASGKVDRDQFDATYRHIIQLATQHG